MKTQSYDVKIWRKARNGQNKQHLGTVVVRAGSAREAISEAKSRFTAGEHKYLGGKILAKGF